MSLHGTTARRTFRSSAQGMGGHGHLVARKGIALTALGLTIALIVTPPITLHAQTGRSPFDDVPGAPSPSQKRVGPVPPGASQEGNAVSERSPFDIPPSVQRVVQKSRDFILLDDKKGVIRSGPGIPIYRVERVDGQRLRLAVPGESEGSSGWVAADQVIAVEKAIDFFADRIRTQPDDAFAYRMRGILWRDRADSLSSPFEMDSSQKNGSAALVKALADLNEAIRREPRNADTFIERGWTWQRRGDFDKAMADFQEAIQLGGGTADLYNTMGESWASRENYDKAIADYTEAIRLDPKNADRYTKRGNAWYSKAEYDKAIADYREVIRLDPQNARAYRDRGDAWSMKGENVKAVTDYNEAIRRDPSDDFTYTSRASIWVANNQYDRALADYTEAIRRNPENGFAYRKRGETWIEKREYDKAIADFTEALERGQNDADLFTRRGDAWYTKGDNDKAIADFSEAIRIDPENASSHARRGDAWFMKEQLDKAKTDYDAAIRLDPQEAPAYTSRGLVWERKAEYDQAFADFSQAIRSEPDNVIAYRNRGIVLRNKGESDKAIVDFSRAIRLEPRNAGAYLNRGPCWRDKGDIEKAVADYDEAIGRDPQLVGAYSSRGIARRDMTQWDKAISDFDTVIRLDPKETFPHYHRAVLLLATHREGAADGAQAVLDLQGWRGNFSMYAVLVGHFAARCADQADRARALLDEAKARCDRSAWPYPIIEYLLGEIDEAKLLAAAIDNDKMTEARCFLGLDALTTGRKEAAEAHFHWVKDQGNPRFTQYAMSVAELDRLLAEGAEGDGP